MIIDLTTPEQNNLCEAFNGTLEPVPHNGLKDVQIRPSEDGWRVDVLGKYLCGTTGEMREIFVDHTEQFPGTWTVDFEALKETLKQASMIQWQHLPPVQSEYARRMLARSVRDDFDFRLLRDIARLQGDDLPATPDMWDSHEAVIEETLAWVDDHGDIHLKGRIDKHNYLMETTDGS